MKRHITSIILAALCAVAAMAQTKVSILGDSYSTFGGWVSPAWNLCWYNGADRGNGINDVERVEDTWWHRLITEDGMQLEKNNSYSGSTVCCRGYRGDDFSDRTFISRVNDLGDPDLILVFGGTNDSWAKSPIGHFQFGDWTKESLFSFRPAFAYLLDRLTALYPEATIVNITNSELSDDVTNSMELICDYYKVKNVKLHDIDKQSGHPSVKGMGEIKRQVSEALH